MMQTLLSFHVGSVLRMSLQKPITLAFLVDMQHIHDLSSLRQGFGNFFLGMMVFLDREAPSEVRKTGNRLT